MVQIFLNDGVEVEMRIISWKLIRKILKKQGYNDTAITVMIEKEKLRMIAEESCEKVVKKLFKRLLRAAGKFLWPEKRKWGNYLDPHDLACNALHSFPLGCPGCSCVSRRKREKLEEQK